MSSFAIILILMSALLHAGWNFISKRSSPSAAFFLIANSIGAWIIFPWVILVPMATMLPGRGELLGACSRRINIRHRLVCQIMEKERVVKVIRMWSHYE